MIKFNATEQEEKLIEAIAIRAVRMAASNGWPYPKGEAIMDIEATHCNGNPLKLAELLEASNGDFAHDVFSIYRHIDRNTGKLMDGFSPRYSAQQEVENAE